MLVSQQWEDQVMRDFYIEVASEAVHHDVCAIIAPDFRHTDGPIGSRETVPGTFSSRPLFRRQQRGSTARTWLLGGGDC
jgi:hypothetical protein